MNSIDFDESFLPPKKIDRYLYLLNNQKALVNSSQSIIRKKHSPLAVAIRRGDSDAIKRAAIDVLHGRLGKGGRENLCFILCEFKRRLALKESNRSTFNEVAAWAISAFAAMVDISTGLVIALLWALRAKLSDALCPCGLTGKCRE